MGNHYLNQALHREQQKRAADARKMREAGMRPTDIARRMGVSRRTIHKYLSAGRPAAGA